MFKTVCVLAAAFVAASALSQTNPAPQSWLQEPTAFLGIQFDKPLTASLPGCPLVTRFGMTDFDWTATSAPCFILKNGFYEAFNLAPFFHVYVTLIDGKVEYVSGQFQNGNAASLAKVDATGITAALVEKFGPAHESSADVVRTGAGVPYDRRELAWQGRDVRIEYSSISDRFDYGLVCAYTASFAATQKRDAASHQDAVKAVL